MKAKNLMYAVKDTYDMVGVGESYSISKTNTFLRRCGADINLPDADIPLIRIKEVAYAMLDRDYEEILLRKCQ